MVQLRKLKKAMEARDHFKNGASSKSLMSRKNIVALLLFFIPFSLSGQMKEYSIRGQEKEINDVRFHQTIDEKYSFTGKELKDKTYSLSVKEVLNGKITRDSTFFDSKNDWYGMDVPSSFKIVGDSIFTVGVNPHLAFEDSSKLKVQFIFPQRFIITRYFDAIYPKEYRTKQTVWSKMGQIDDNIYAMVCILPSDVKWDTNIGMRGKDIETWGKDFGINHYIVFEIKLE